MNIAELHKLFKSSTGICTDTRKLKTGQLFFALKGDNFNGNLYAINALEKGAAFAIVDEIITPNDKLILVEDVLSTLQMLAAYHRQQKQIPIIGITGSNGKTTTKELIHQVLKKKYKTIATVGNLNNHIGVPLSLLTIEDDTEIAIIEMGANHIGEIASYCVWAKPNYAMITNIGLAHLEGFGGPEGVRIAKSELYQSVMQDAGTIFVNKDDSVLQEILKDYSPVFSYGLSAQADVIASIMQEASSLLSINWKGHSIKTNLVGDYNFPNVMAAIAIASFFKVTDEEIVEALEAYMPDNNRSQIKQIESNTFILDAYNANPSSLKLAIENFGNSDFQKKMIIIGEMKEMGSYSNQVHQEIVDEIRKYKFNKIILVGKAFKDMLSAAEGLCFETTDEAKIWWQAAQITNYHILMKGSRGMALEKILAA